MVVSLSRSTKLCSISGISLPVGSIAGFWFCARLTGRARRIINEFENADTGMIVIDGKLIEKPVMREMYRIAAIADRLEQ